MVGCLSLPLVFGETFVHSDFAFASPQSLSPCRQSLRLFALDCAYHGARLVCHLARLNPQRRLARCVWNGRRARQLAFACLQLRRSDSKKPIRKKRSQSFSASATVLVRVASRLQAVPAPVADGALTLELGMAVPRCGHRSVAAARMEYACLMGSLSPVRRMSTTRADASSAAAAVGGTTDTPSLSSTVSEARAPPKSALVKVGDVGEWTSFQQEALMSMDRTGLLTALKQHDVFGHKLKTTDLSDCSIELLTLPAGADEPSAADEARDKMKGLKGAKTLGAVAESIASGDGEQLCIRVRLPTDASRHRFGESP